MEQKQQELKENKSELNNPNKNNSQEQQGNQNEQNVQQDFNDLEDDLDQFNEKLNLTAGEDDIKNFVNDDLEKEYKKFINNIENDGNEQLPQFQDIFSNLLQGLGNMAQNQQSNTNQNEKEEKKEFEQFDQFFKNLQNNEQEKFDNSEKIFENVNQNPQFENFANQLLNEFMDKEIIYEPLKDAQNTYIQFFSNSNQSHNDIDLKRYKQQHEIINQIIKNLDENPDDKEKIIQLFEQMQQFGNPPEMIAEKMGKDSPFEMFNKNKNQQNQDLDQDCNIF